MAALRRKASYAERRASKAEVDDPAVVLDAALRLLEVRPRSVDEVRRRLATAGYRLELVEPAIERLLALGILDDESFTAAWVESRDRVRPRGERALRDELRRKGVGRALIDDALATRRPEPGGSEDPDVEAAGRLVARHAAQLGRIADPRQRRQRAYALLARNGFDPEICSRVSALAVDRPEPDGDGDAGLGREDEPAPPGQVR